MALKRGWPEKIVNMAYHHKRLHIHKLVHVMYRILLKMESKERNDYSLTKPDLVVAALISIMPIGYFLFRLFVSVNLMQILKVLMVWVLVIGLCLLFVYVFYRIKFARLK